MMRLALVAALTASFASLAAADTKPTADELAKIKATLAVWGCNTDKGEYEKETEGTGLYEANDVRCKDGQNFDIKMDDKFKVISMTRD